MTDAARLLVVAEAVALGALVLLVLGIASSRMLRARADAAPLAAARSAIGSAVLRKADAQAAARALRRLRPSARIRVVTELARDLGPDERATLAAIADDAGLIERAARACASPRWWERIQAIRLLAALGRGQIEVPPLLTDRHPLVRAEAAFWVGEVRRSDLAFVLVGMVEAETGLARPSAQDALIRLGASAGPALRERLARSGVASRALMRVIAASPPPEARPQIARMAADPIGDQRDLALEALATVGGATAAEIVIAAFDDARPEVRVAAATAAGRLGDARAAPALAGAMADASWDVRLAAARALHTLGPAGMLYLRHVREGGDAYAAEMARHVIATAGTPR